MKGRREKYVFSGSGYQGDIGGHKERGHEGEYGFSPVPLSWITLF
jgi:hypothetical protein